MIIDWTLTVGNILTLVAMLGGGFGMLALMRSDLRLLTYRLDSLEASNKLQGAKIDKLSDVLTVFARYEERMNSMERRIEELRHGKGWIIEDFNQYGKLPPGGRAAP